MRKKNVTLDLRELQIVFEPYQEPGPQVRLPLWDGVSISETGGPRFGRIQMMSVKASMFSRDGGDGK